MTKVGSHLSIRQRCMQGQRLASLTGDSIMTIGVNAAHEGFLFLIAQSNISHADLATRNIFRIGLFLLSKTDSLS